jgi:1,4-dihydroxy-2-naphthoyl-CoA hydrolase
MRFTYYRTIRLSDTDAAGVIYFAHLLSICHEAYETSLETVGIDLKTFFDNSSLAIPIVFCSADFSRPIFCGDKLAIRLNSKQLQENEFEIDYSIHRRLSLTECLATAKTRHVCINPIARRRTSLPEAMMKWLVLESPLLDDK